MNLQEAVRAQLGFWHGTLDQMVAGCDDAILHRAIDNSKTNTIAATYAHAVISEDVLANAMIQGKAPIFDAGWAAKTGVAFPGVPPMLTPEWAANIKLNRTAFSEYAAAVYGATDAFLAGLTDAESARKLQGPMGETTVGWMVAVLLATHYPGHAGEIAALKGVHGLQGLPF